MILKKPYAFFLKHFKLIHLIVTLFTCYIAYKTVGIFSFFNEYLKVPTYTIDKGVSISLFNAFLYISIIIVLLISILIMFLMRYKHKPILFYAINIISMVFTLVLVIYTYYSVISLETSFIDVRTLRLIRDFLLIIFIIQTITIIFLSLRSLGLNTSKFKFDEIDINDEDKEEFVMNVEIDSDKFKREFKKNIRNIKYTYKENKTIIKLFILIIIGIISFFIYRSMTTYNKTYKNGEVSTSTEFNLGIIDAYYTNIDYQTNKLTNNNLILLKIKIKSRYTNSDKLEISRMKLVIGSSSYYPTSSYNDKFIDIGDTYNNEKIAKDDFKEYLIVYEVGSNLDIKKVKLKYYDTNDKNITVSLKTKEVDKLEKIEIHNIGEEIDFKDSLLKDTKLKITEYSLESQYKLNYIFCVSTNSCYDSYEYIMPNLNTNQNKILMKVTGDLSINSNLSSKINNDLGDFITQFGEIKYKINDEEQTMKLKLSQVKPKKSKNGNDYYIEVLEEIQYAKELKLSFIIRGHIYRYILKEGE